MIRPLTHLAACLGEVLAVQSKAAAQEVTAWSVLCVGASVAAAAWSLYYMRTQKAIENATQWQKYGLEVEPCRAAN